MKRSYIIFLFIFLCVEAKVTLADGPLQVGSESQKKEKISYLSNLKEQKLTTQQLSDMKKGDIPILFKADEIIYQEHEKVIIAKGNVEVTQFVLNVGWRVLRSDRLRFDQKQDKIFVYGNVKLKEPSGDIIFTESAEFTGDFKKGVIETLRLWTKDESQLSALNGYREDGKETHFKKAIYSPCKVCRKNDGGSTLPLWQIKAEKTVHDKESQTITYYNARLELKGVPVFYMPYFSHPDPKVKRKSGLLFPTFGVTKDLGTLVSLPVYHAITPNQDLTITPIKTTKQGGIITSDYRRRFRDGEAALSGSYTRTRGLQPATTPQPLNGPRLPKPDRWHLMSKVKYDIDDDRRMSLDFNRASDTTYLGRYPVVTQRAPSFIQNRNLTSTLNFEKFHGDSYLGAKGLLFQTDAPKTTPLVLPSARYHNQYEPDKLGGIISTDGNLLSLTRQTPVPGRLATQMQRLSTGIGWKLPYQTQNGQLVTFQANGRVDAYYFRRYQFSATPLAGPRESHLEHTTGRIFPQTSIDWRYPFLKQLSHADWILQPMAMVAASPPQLINLHTPNEDSTTFELDDTTLFLPNRFDGIDRTDTGYRTVYGAENTFNFSRQRSVNVFLGQSRRLDHRKVVAPGLGEDQNQSDYVMRLKVKPIKWLTTRYRCSINPQDNRPRYSELGFTVGQKAFRLDAGYVYLNKKATAKQQDISQVNFQVSSQVVDNWSLSLGQIRNLKHNHGGSSLANFLLATYKDECFQVDAGLYKTSYNDRDIHPDSGFLIQITFKNLGNFTPYNAPRYPGSPLTAF
ncbi:MAG: LPS assembly protein LptD [Alphaproteobacteria bacterium]|nr:LPS assembly protein LptD [Alphaproteobacteria bacterium]